MKITIQLSAILVSSMLLFACGGSETKVNYDSEVDMGKFDGHNYTCNELGWETSYPQGPTITKKEALLSLNERSRKAAGDSSDADNSVKYLLSYGYDFNNSFSSNVQSFKDKTEDDYKTAKANLHTVVYDNYYSAGIRVDTSVSKVKVGKVNFDVWKINLYDENAKAYAHQEMFTAMINGYFFSAAVSYHSDFYRNKMVTTITKSKFK